MTISILAALIASVLALGGSILVLSRCRDWRCEAFGAVTAASAALLALHLLQRAYLGEGRPGVFSGKEDLVSILAGLLLVIAVCLVERLARQREAAETEVRMPQFALDSAAIAVFWIGAEGQLLYANRWARETLGYEEAELLTKSIHDIAPDVPREAWRRHWGGLKPGGARFLETSFRCRDGTLLPVDVRTSHLASAGEARACVFARDITRRKRAEAEVRAAREAAQLADSANDAKSVFLANVSHELRTPLTSIIGFAEILQEERFGPLGNRDYRDYAANIRESGTDLLGLINDILDISKIEAGRMELSEEDSELGHVVAGSLRLIGQRAQEAGLEIIDRVPAGLPAICADVRALKQVLLNLLSNAIKFTPAGGSITLTAGLDLDGSLWLSVQDTGIGIARQHQHLVFEPFEQVENTRTHRYPGTGLGLPIASKLVRLHGGDLELESELAEGTKVTLRLPGSRVLGRDGRPQSPEASAGPGAGQPAAWRAQA